MNNNPYVVFILTTKVERLINDDPSSSKVDSVWYKLLESLLNPKLLKTLTQEAHNKQWSALQEIFDRSFNIQIIMGIPTQRYQRYLTNQQVKSNQVHNNGQPFLNFCDEILLHIIYDIAQCGTLDDIQNIKKTSKKLNGLCQDRSISRLELVLYFKEKKTTLKSAVKLLQVLTTTIDNDSPHTSLFHYQDEIVKSFADLIDKPQQGAAKNIVRSLGLAILLMCKDEKFCNERFELKWLNSLSPLFTAVEAKDLLLSGLLKHFSEGTASLKILAVIYAKNNATSLSGEKVNYTIKIGSILENIANCQPVANGLNYTS